MRVLLINIALRPPPARKLLPMGLGFVASAIHRAGIAFDLLDLDARPLSNAQIEGFLSSTPYDVVMMGSIVTGYGHVKNLSAIIRRAFPSTLIVAGNTVAESILDTLLAKTDVDVAVLGEGDETAVDLLLHVQRRAPLQRVKGIALKTPTGILRTPRRPVIEDLDAIPPPNWDLFDVETYIESASQAVNEPLPPIGRDAIRSMPINTARGCPFKCTFCHHAFHADRYRYRSARAVVEEMKSRHVRYGINHFAFNDELTFHSPAQAERFADELALSGLRVYWGANCRSGLFQSDDDVRVIRKLHDVGCLSLVFSLESADVAILRSMNKRATPEAFARQVGLLRKGGIAPLTSIVVGFPEETPETIRKTIRFCAALGIYPSAGFLLPQPGSVMYDRARAAGHIPNEEQYLLAMGDRQDLRLNLTTMSDDTLRSVVEEELAACAAATGIAFGSGTLLKTGAYRSGDTGVAPAQSASARDGAPPLRGSAPVSPIFRSPDTAGAQRATLRLVERARERAERDGLFHAV